MNPHGPSPVKYASTKRLIIDTIIDKLKTQNVTDVTDVKHFFKNPYREIDEEELPCIKIAIMNDSPEWFSNKIEYMRKPTLVVAYCEKGNDDLADKLYHYGERLERFLINDENTTQINGLVNSLVLKSAALNLENANMGIGAYVIQFDLDYIEEHIAPLDDLETIHLEIKSGAAPAEDPPIYEETITLPTD